MCALVNARDMYETRKKMTKIHRASGELEMLNRSEGGTGSKKEAQKCLSKVQQGDTVKSRR